MNNKPTELRYGNNVQSLLSELASYDAADIDGDEFDVYGEDSDGREGCATISITELAADAAKLLAALGADPVYQCEFCHHDENGELQWHWEDVNKSFYDQYDSERRGKRRVLYTAPPVPYAAMLES
ncbi:hypothetical protein [Enterobacter roggenkampii]|uniref:hypothetical protein n=1 Tax=Enterobacter roggenkampii TaxID=1812935 RepID=UPI00388E108D